MNRIIVISIFILFIISSCNDVRINNTTPTNKILLIDYNENTECRVLEIYQKENINRIDSFCGDISMMIDDFSNFYSKYNIFYADQILKPNELSVLLFWDYDYIKEVDSFPFKYSQIEIDSIQSDSILWFQLIGKNKSLLPNEVFQDSILKIENEKNRKIEHFTTFYIKNCGVLRKENIYDNDSWPGKSKELGLDKLFGVDEMPKFIGGDSALIDYIRKNLVYPKSAKKNNIEGVVYVSFFVDTLGNACNVAVFRGIDPSLDSAAVKVIELLPKWIPAKINGRDTMFRMSIPVKFDLNNNR